MPLYLPAPAASPLPALVDAKGDIIVGTADNTIARLPVGSNTQVLTADSAQASGVKWAPAASGGGTPPWAPIIPIPEYSAGKWVSAFITTQQPGGGEHGLVSLGYHLAQPFIPARTFTADRVSCLVYSDVASAGLRIGLYGSDADNIIPENLIAEWGVFDCSTSGLKAITISQTFTAGTLYWLACVGVTAPPDIRTYFATLQPRIPGGSQVEAHEPPGRTGAEWDRGAGGYGSFAATWGSGDYGGANYSFAFRMA